jgi:hypothetical protein
MAHSNYDGRPRSLFHFAGLSALQLAAAIAGINRANRVFVERKFRSTMCINEHFFNGEKEQTFA